jgi:dynein heavy chain
MGRCHDMVNEMCDVYDAKMRRKVFVTPKSYLSFIDLYKKIYSKRFGGIDKEEQNIVKGLDALDEAAEGVKQLEIKLQKDSAEVNEKKAATDKLLHTLTIEAKKAKEKSDEVNETTIKLRGDQEIVMKEKEEAQVELDKAMPYLEKATAAVDSIKKKDVDTMAKATTAHCITMFVLDAMQILFYKQLDIPCKPATYDVAKKSFTFAQFSYDNHTKFTLR